MMHLMKPAVFALVATLAFGAIPGTAQAATIIDLTAGPQGNPATASLTGTVFGVGYTITGLPVDPNNVQTFDGNLGDIDQSAGTIASGLSFTTDGLGVIDDEVANISESITIKFDKAVKFLGFAFLDLFRTAADARAGETAFATTGNGTVYALPANLGGASSTPGVGASGYAEIFNLNEIVWSITFTVGAINDPFGVADAALAGIAVAPVPLPAAGFLMLGGLGGLVLVRRRRKAA
ncbi:VPLPA-CTERM sorting domain-containing protein [Tabrizicola sp. WMC-M-20]|nr:VPLPA-CTERM sorting domain-containing protein [Tabrizicola sp. WMC-M-20]